MFLNHISTMDTYKLSSNKRSECLQLEYSLKNIFLAVVDLLLQANLRNISEKSGDGQVLNK